MAQELALSRTPEDIYTVLENVYDFLKFMPKPLAEVQAVEALVEALEGAMQIQDELKEQALKRVKDDLDDMDE